MNFILFDEEVDRRFALLSEPIVGQESVTWDDRDGHGAIPARPLSSPKAMSEAQRKVHDLTPAIPPRLSNLRVLQAPQFLSSELERLRAIDSATGCGLCLSQEGGQ